MIGCKHKLRITDAGELECRTCGQVLDHFEESIVWTQSALRARRVIEEVAVAGEYRPYETQGGVTSFAKYPTPGLRVQVAAIQRGPKRWEVVKRYSQVGPEANEPGGGRGPLQRGD